MSASSCAACGFANPAGALFCGNCGSALGRPCPSCGTVVSPELAFCTSCGAALEEDSGTAGAEERKVISVLFADLVGFTSRAEELDPEDVGSLQTPYYARVKKEIENYGGTVEKFIGDAVMAVFGAPVAHEDDAARALLAALAIRDALADQNADDSELDLHIRIAVTTGEALVRLGARPEQGEGIAAGDVVNTASRLQSAAPVDGILVDDATRRATEHLVEYREATPVQAKGKSEPVPAWEAVTRIARLGVDIAFRGGASLVGRDAELATLRDALARAEHARDPQLVTLVGVPGIGKSRLVWELYEALHTDPSVLVAWRQGRSLPYGEGVAYWALGEMIKSHAGVLESDDARAAEAKLRAAVDAVIADKAQAGWVEGHLRPLVGLGGGSEPGADGRNEAFSAWRRFFEAIAESNPLALVFEDLHWADDDLLDFVDYMADWTSGVPLVLVCTARPELLDRRPGWGGGKRNATTISLSPLSQQDTAELVASLLDGQLHGTRRTELLARAGGNPLYAEEFVRMLTQAEEEIPLPESVQGIIAARLDTLPKEEKTLLQAAAIVGKVFWPDALAHLLGKPHDVIDQRLQTLERREFVRRERRSSIAGENAYVFRHVLVRDVAYSQIPRRRRAEMHRLAADWIEALAGDRPEDLADMVAHHYVTALDLLRRMGQSDQEVSDRTRNALLEAGDRSFALNAFSPAARFYEQALALWPEDDADRPLLLLASGRALFHAEGGGLSALEQAADELVDAGDRENAATALIASAEVLFFTEGRAQEAAERADSAVALLADQPPTRAKTAVLANRARFHMIADEFDEAIEQARQAILLAEELGLDELHAHALSTLGVARTFTGDAGGLEDLERSVAIARPYTFDAVRTLNNLAAVLTELGELERAFAVNERSLAEARRFGHAVAITWAETQMLDRLYWEGDWDELLRRGEETLIAPAVGARSITAIDVHILRARIRLARGDEAGALEDSARAIDLAEAEPQVAFPALCTRAQILLETGNEAEAGDLATELLERWHKSASGYAGPYVIELAFVLERLGREVDLHAVTDRIRVGTHWLEAAEALVAGNAGEAAEICERIGARADAAVLRLRSAALLSSAGRHAEAEAALAPAIEFFRGVGATRYIRDAEALLPVS